MKRVNIHLTQRQLEALRKSSNKTGLSVAEIVRRVIDEYLEKKEKGKN